MAKVEILPKVEGLAVGVLDAFLAKKDAEAGRTEVFKKWVTWERIIALAGGAVAEYMNFYPKYAAPLATAGATMVGQTLGDYLLNMSAAPAAASVVTRVRTPVRTQVTRSYEQEFKPAKVF